MEILIYSNMAPSPEIDYAGIFVKNQFEYLKRNDPKNNYGLLAMPKTFTGKIGSIKKYSIFIFKSLRHLFRKNLNIIHLHYFFPLAILPWLAKKILGTKLVVTIHGSDFYAKMNNPFIFKLYKHILKDYDYIICVGEQLGHDFETKFGIKANSILCAGVDRSTFYYKPSVAKEFDFSFVGTLTERKGIDIVIEVIRRTVPNGYRWCIVGTGAYLSKIEELAFNYPQNVTFYRKRSQHELNSIYNKSKWFFFPSRNEPFGLVASECLFSGTPVLTTNSGGLKEQVKHEFNGFIIQNQDDVESCVALATQAFELDEVRYNELVTNCIASSKFSLDFVCKSLEKIYSTL